MCLYLQGLCLMSSTNMANKIAKSIPLTQGDSIQTITIQNQKANCLSSDVVKMALDNLQAAEINPELKLIVIQSSSLEIFSAGADLAEYSEERTEKQIAEYLFNLGQLLVNLAFSSKYVLGIVSGKAVGGALGLIAACDYILASEGAEAKLPELSLGLAPSIISPFLIRKIGAAHLKTLSFGSTWNNSERLYQMGLFSEICKAGDLEKRSIQLKEEFSCRSIVPVKEYKKFFYPPKSKLLNEIKQLSKKNAKWIKSREGQKKTKVVHE